jgi:hypothetical protein
MRRSEPERIVRLLLLIPKTFLTVTFSKHGERREGDRVAERARATEMNVAQGELREAREDASGRDGDAEAAEVE